MASPSVRDSQWPQLRQTVNQYMDSARNRAGSHPDLEVHKKAFQAAVARLPDQLQEVLQEKYLKTNYKKAGTESNQRAAAATAWIHQNHPEWQLSTMAWAGDCDLKIASDCRNGSRSGHCGGGRNSSSGTSLAAAVEVAVPVAVAVGVAGGGGGVVVVVVLIVVSSRSSSSSSSTSSSSSRGSRRRRRRSRSSSSTNSSK